jgi:hypothetical protein
MNDNTHPRILAKRIEMIAWNLAGACRDGQREAAAVAPIAETADTVTLRRSDYDALIRRARVSGDAI